MQYDDVEIDEELILYSKGTGYLKAWADETKKSFEGLAFLKVGLNSAVLPGISGMTVNTNTFDVWKAENPEALKRVADAFLKPEYTR